MGRELDDGVCGDIQYAADAGRISPAPIPRLHSRDMGVPSHNKRSISQVVRAPLIPCAALPEQRRLQAILADAGWSPTVIDDMVSLDQLKQHPAVLLHGSAASGMGVWLDYVRAGGVLILIEPCQWATACGFVGGAPEVANAVLELPRDSHGNRVPVHVSGRIPLYDGGAAGTTLAGFRPTADTPRSSPGILELTMGRGRLLLLFFSLATTVEFLRQRSKTYLRSVGADSAEAILLHGLDRDLWHAPQVDALMEFLSTYLRGAHAAGPFPELCKVPAGYRSMLLFSSDDMCASKRPLLAAEPTLRSRLYQLAHYPSNYIDDIAALQAVFKRYGGRPTGFLLPFLLGVKNRPAVTGYRGFDPEMARSLNDDGWDLATHLQPTGQPAYTAVHRAFTARFGQPPAGHRGHELGWGSYDEDWASMHRLGYRYDSTWTWGGCVAPTWIAGTSYPFHPVDQSGLPFPVLEIPVTAWLDDLVSDPVRSLQRIEHNRDLHPGICHIGGHSRGARDPIYAGRLEQLLAHAHARMDIAVDWSLARLANFWGNRERSGVRECTVRDLGGEVSLLVDSRCDDGDLAVRLPDGCVRVRLLRASIGFA